MRWILAILLLSGCGGSSPTAPRDSDGDGYEVDVDCCDKDDRVFPGQLRFFSKASIGDSFDFDCDGTEELEDPHLHKCFEGEDWCSWKEIGWDLRVPECGQLGQWVTTCGYEGLKCAPVFEEKTQACR